MNKLWAKVRAENGCARIRVFLRTSKWTSYSMGVAERECGESAFAAVADVVAGLIAKRGKEDSATRENYYDKDSKTKASPFRMPGKSKRKVKN